MLQRCEASAMDFAVYGNNDLPLCDNVASITVDGYDLCYDCNEALEILKSIGGSILGYGAS